MPGRWLIDFLRHHEAETLFLVGDIVDGWQLRSSWYWPTAHNAVVQELAELARRGKRLVYVAGNHDEFVRDYVGSTFGGIELAEHAIHRGVDGRAISSSMATISISSCVTPAGSLCLAMSLIVQRCPPTSG